MARQPLEASEDLVETPARPCKATNTLICKKKVLRSVERSSLTSTAKDFIVIIKNPNCK